MPLTEYQELAVTSRGGSRLVSAAAGSGKTRVLVERLLRRVEAGANIDDFLVVTYTRAAAGELRSRILAALNQRLAADPANRRLRRQTELCCRADIGTIDSICGRFLRQNTHLAGIAPDFKVIEPERADAIRSAVLERLLESVYETIDDHPGRKALVDSFGAGRDDAALSELILQLHDSVQSHPHPDRWLAEQRRALYPGEARDAGETPWGRYLLSGTRSRAEYWAARLEGLVRQMREPGHEKLFKGYGAGVAELADDMRRVSAAAENGWEAVRAALPTAFSRVSFRGEDPLADSVKAARSDCKDVCEELRRVYADDSETLLAELEATAPAMEALLELTDALDRAYAAEKRRQGVVDFSDQEHMMLALLEDEGNGLAAALSARYTEVLVDEYQDVNACQDALFRLLSDGGRKLFMVGDVKQSIYRFRLADPTIFLDKYARWKDVSPDLAPGEPGRILLRENFRSRPEILAAANHIFSNIMSPELGELRYDGAAALRPGLAAEPDPGARVTFALLSRPEAGEDERPDTMALEAAWVAGRIRSLLDGGLTVAEEGGRRRAEYGDFAILLRSHRSAAERYRAALEAEGIPSVSQQGGGFFRSLEVTVMLSLLAVIDNPRQDVALIAALRSPLYGFTADDLAAIRGTDKDADFYTALTLAAADMPKCAAFLAELEEYRSLAADLSVEALMERICGRRDLYALLSAMPDADARRENLRSLADYARQFEADGYRGVFRFLSWMRRLEKQGEEPRTGSVERRQAVQIISVHHSKGLEYPVVFLSGTGRRFNKSDTRKAVLIHPELGVGGKVTDTVRGIRYPSLAWRAIAEKREQEALSEEMRVLYVALTRAKERLYISGLWPDGDKLTARLREGLTSPIAPELLRRDPSGGCWLLRTALLPDSPLILERAVPALKEGPPPAPPAPEAPPEPSPDAPPEWVYPAGWAAALPSKLTASALEGPEDPDRDARSVLPLRRSPPRRPRLGADAPLTAAERGTAVHTALQYVDYARCTDPEGVRQELSRLLAEGRLTPAQAEAADPEMILSFFRSEAGRRVLSADQVWRELRFSLLAGAEEFFPVPAGEQILLQGVVDCCFREGDALTVVDYKTDFVTDETLAGKAREYAPQVRAYALALGRILGLEVKEGIVFFLRAGKSVRIDPREK